MTKSNDDVTEFVQIFYILSLLLSKYLNTSLSLKLNDLNFFVLLCTVPWGAIWLANEPNQKSSHCERTNFVSHIFEEINFLTVLFYLKIVPRMY